MAPTCAQWIKTQCERGRAVRPKGANLERRDVGMGHVAVHILNLRDVLL